MKFRRLACDCCKSSEFPSLCKSPTYFMSEVVDNSNVIFLLMMKRGGASCGGQLAVTRDQADQEQQAVAYESDRREAGDVVWTGRPGAQILAASWRPSHPLASNDDFEPGETPIRRNQRLLEEGSGFWPRRIFNREPDFALRQRE